MSDFTALTLSCSRWQDLVAAKNALNPKLPLEIRKRLNKAFTGSLQRHGLEGTFDRLNNRTVAEILAEHDPADDPTPIASGEVDGVRFELFEAPDKKSTMGQEAGDE
jgi:hypothetical protein